MAKTFVYLHTRKAVRKDDTAVPNINIYYAQSAPRVSFFVSRVSPLLLSRWAECNSIADRVRFIPIRSAQRRETAGTCIG
ncbi:hypothetical protein SBA7_940019 [Candidatus Sulfotelmatobacter sp. SbA7]|nr:hypothetical protein SBA7_940019 [Candidatus Sulfotelmatobacter sp. SbA7]